MTSRFLGRDVPLIYRAVEVDRSATRAAGWPRARTLSRRDEITLDEHADGGTAVTYIADLRLRGPLRVLDPVLRILFYADRRQRARRTGGRS